MNMYLKIGVFAFVFALVPYFIHSEFWISWATMVLFYALLGQAWNILGGYGGQFSFGHAAFFGVGAYCTSLLQIEAGINPWVALVAAGVAGSLVGAATGWLVFRYKLRGSYFALVTLAFAEVFRIMANSLDFTGAGVGLLLPMKFGLANLQFSSKAGFYWLLLLIVSLVLLLTWRIEQSRFGARLVAVRENEEAARAIGVSPFKTKLLAIVISSFLTGIAGALYVQLFLFLDPTIAFGTFISVEALLIPIIGGIGTVFGPVVGSLGLHTISEIGRTALGDAPGLNMVIYGFILIVIVLGMPTGLMGLIKKLASKNPLRKVKHA